MKHKHKIDRPHALRAIKLLYARANGNQSAVARALGVHSAHISDALRTGNISPKLAAALVDRGAIEPIPRRICRAWRTRDPASLKKLDSRLEFLGVANVQELIDGWLADSGRIVISARPMVTTTADRTDLRITGNRPAVSYYDHWTPTPYMCLCDDATCAACKSAGKLPIAEYSKLDKQES